MRMGSQLGKTRGSALDPFVGDIDAKVPREDGVGMGVAMESSEDRDELLVGGAGHGGKGGGARGGGETVSKDKKEIKGRV